MQCSAVQYSTAQCSAVQRSALKCTIVKCSAVKTSESVHTVSSLASAVEVEDRRKDPGVAVEEILELAVYTVTQPPGPWWMHWEGSEIYTA